ncbi:flavodoxin domain-containing protein [Mangrovibacterium sp.]|uniref:flavodoxin domain-containing protein n=1 Tax=Mangrovibacterium sp. TaxID=1961364 RepID=UPI00356AE4B2
MKTIIIFMSTHGFTERTAGDIARLLSGEIEIVNLHHNTNINFSDYDQVILGGSIHAGKIQRQMRVFIKKNLEKLLEKEIGLFISCMYEGEQARIQLENAFPEQLHKKAKAESILGGEFDFKKMNFVERFMVRKIAKTDHSVQRINREAIRLFAKTMNNGITELKMSS